MRMANSPPPYRRRRRPYTMATLSLLLLCLAKSNTAAATTAVRTLREHQSDQHQQQQQYRSYPPSHTISHVLRGGDNGGQQPEQQSPGQEEMYSMHQDRHGDEYHHNTRALVGRVDKNDNNDGFEELNDLPTAEQLAQEMADIQSYKQAKLNYKNNDGSTAPLVITVPTYFHILQTRDDELLVSESRIYQYLHQLNEAFDPTTPFRFVLQDITRTVNAKWSNGGFYQQNEYKRVLKVGGPETLNVYIVNGIPKNDGATLAGFAYLPSTVGGINDVLDGVVVAETFHGDQQRLGTLVHEVGHYLGLLHTFNGDSCDDGIPGDGVPDTPQHLKPSLGALTDRCDAMIDMDSCTGLPGTDPVYNYMTYSRDNTCRNHFSTGQIDRMEYQWETYRARDRGEDDSLLFTNRPSSTPPECAGMFGGCEYNDCCGGTCWRGLLFGLLPDFCFF